MALAAVCGLVVLGTIGSGEPTRHGIVGSSPIHQATLPTAPTAVELTFAATPVRDRSHVVVIDSLHVIVNSGALTANDKTLRQPVSIDRPGPVTIDYHVMFHDGGEARGRISFSVGQHAAPPPDASLPDVHDHEIDPLSAWLLVANAAVALTTVGLLVFRRPRREAPPT